MELYSAVKAAKSASFCAWSQVCAPTGCAKGKKQKASAAKQNPDSEAHREKRRPFRTAPQGIFADTRQALRAIRMEMDRRRFWPAIYHVNDHGNVTLLSQTGREVAAWV